MSTSNNEPKDGEHPKDEKPEPKPGSIEARNAAYRRDFELYGPYRTDSMFCDVWINLDRDGELIE